MVNDPLAPPLATSYFEIQKFLLNSFLLAIVGILSPMVSGTCLCSNAIWVFIANGNLDKLSSLYYPINYNYPNTIKLPYWWSVKYLRQDVVHRQQDTNYRHYDNKLTRSISINCGKIFHWLYNTRYYKAKQVETLLAMKPTKENYFQYK